MSVPYGHWKTTTFTGALRLTGMTAPMGLDGPMTGEWFLAYVEQVLVPTLSPGDVVIMDNLPATKAPPSATPSRRAVPGCSSPAILADLTRSRTPSQSSRRCSAKPLPEPFDQLWIVIGDSIDAFTPDECANYFRHAGYDTY